MNDNRPQALISYLQVLAMLQRTNETYVRNEINEVMREIERELNLNKK